MYEDDEFGRPWGVSAVIVLGLILWLVVIVGGITWWYLGSR